MTGFALLPVTPKAQRLHRTWHFIEESRVLLSQVTAVRDRRFPLAPEAVRRAMLRLSSLRLRASAAGADLVPTSEFRPAHDVVDKPQLGDDRRREHEGVRIAEPEAAIQVVQHVG